MIEVYGHIVGAQRIADQRKPLHDVALDGLSDIVHGVGAVGKAEVDNGRGVRVLIPDRACVAPKKIGGVQVVVGPERCERGEMRRKLGVKGREKLESLLRTCTDGFVRSERGAGGDIVFQRCGRIVVGKDREACNERARLTPWRIEVLRGTMQQRHHCACGVRVGNTAERRPRECLFVNVDAGRNLVDLVCPLARLDGCFAGRGSQDARDERDMGANMSEKTMLLEKSFAITHRAMMAFNEDALLRSMFVARGDDSSSGERARAHGENMRRLAELEELRQKRAQFIERERSPIRLNQRTIHAV